MDLVSIASSLSSQIITRKYKFFFPELSEIANRTCQGSNSKYTRGRGKVLELTGANVCARNEKKSGYFL